MKKIRRGTLNQKPSRDTTNATHEAKSNTRAIDGAGEWHAFRTVVFPALWPINIVIIVVTVIEALRAFDIVYIINRGRNGLELLSVLVTNNIIGEASRIGYGSAIAVILIVISIIPIVVFVWNNFSEKQA